MRRGTPTQTGAASGSRRGASEGAVHPALLLKSRFTSVPPPRVEARSAARKQQAEVAADLVRSGGLLPLAVRIRLLAFVVGVVAVPRAIARDPRRRRVESAASAQ